MSDGKYSDLQKIRETQQGGESHNDAMSFILCITRLYVDCPICHHKIGSGAVNADGKLARVTVTATCHSCGATLVSNCSWRKLTASSLLIALPITLTIAHLLGIDGPIAQNKFGLPVCIFLLIMCSRIIRWVIIVHFCKFAAIGGTHDKI